MPEDKREFRKKQWKIKAAKGEEEEVLRRFHFHQEKSSAGLDADSLPEFLVALLFGIVERVKG
jgi:hypothetical protein